MKETNEISLHAVRVFALLIDRVATQEHGWVTAKEIADGAEIAPRTARAYAKRFVESGIADLAEVFPAHRYRLSPTAEKRNKGYYQRLEQAMQVFGIK
jgi:predicted transcriptional regulator of viral defense system